MKNNFALLVSCSLGGIILAIGCQRSSPNTVHRDTAAVSLPATIVEGTGPTDEEKGKLLAAKDALFAKLSGRLMDVVSTEGPPAAIKVCQLEAKSIAEEVGKTANVKIGRTGVRLRNSENQPPPWAEALVAQKTEQPVFAKLSDNRAVALLPIRIQAQCLMCHGPSDALAPGVKATLAKLYPRDSATEFAEGDLRGWFWIESLD